MSLELDVQVALDCPGLPEEGALRRWAEAALAAAGSAGDVELTIRLVNEAESEALNGQYRHKQGPTNVLSFPFEVPAGVTLAGPRPLGDIVICAPVVLAEAVTQGKRAEAHWAHMVVHGVLHLLGYDHVEEAEAVAMENLETRVLNELGYPDPYAEPDRHE
ncbi:MAG TPA: rRNA maturation RNase YbeY [Candidatus Competibacteraceae bacterium]|nr:rRNA maturation RNase YbeY [Candidatus Competibacteraceae bacterium]